MRNSLTTKIFSIFFLMIIVTFIIEALNLTYFKLPLLYTLEAHSDQKDIDRIKNAFESVTNELAVLSYDNAVWDDTYEFINHKNPDFAKKNLILDVYKSLGINGIHIYDKQANLVWGQTYTRNRWKRINFPPFDKPNTFVKNSIITPANLSKEISNRPIPSKGFIVLNKNLLYFAATSVTNAHFNTPANGTLVFWRFVDDSLLKNLHKRSGIKFTIELLTRSGNKVVKNSKNSYINHSYRTKSGEIYDYIELTNNNKVIRFSYPAPVRQFEIDWFNQSAIISSISFSTTLLIVYLLIHFIIIKPITNAKKLVKTLINNTNRQVRFNSIRKDELGSLFNLIDSLLDDVASKEQELISHNLRLQKISRTDGLTKIANRRAFDIHIKNTITNSLANIPVSLLVCDVDFFKKYNDFYGHAMGDKTLRLIAENLQRNLHEETDFVARYGGEEFVIVLNDTNLENAASVANNLLSCIEKLNISHEKSTVSRAITISIGMHTFIASEQETVNDLFIQADSAVFSQRKRPEQGLFIIRFK